MKKHVLLCLLLTAWMLGALVPLTTLPAGAADEIVMEPYYDQPFQPEGKIFGQVSFLVPGGTQGLTKDAWDDNIDHNTDLILVSFVKDGVVYENMTIREVKAQFGDLALKRTCYTYDDLPTGMLRLNLVLHMDDHPTLKPSDFIAITIKAGFVWCAGSPSGISKELSNIVLDRDVSFPVNVTAGITAVKTGPMNGVDGALRINFERKDSGSLKAISAVDLCPSAIPGKTLGDLVTINGETVTDLVEKGNVARFNFYGDTLIFHIDDPAYLAKLKQEQYEIVILPGFRWMNWDRDDWGNWAGTNKDRYTPVDGTLVTAPISFMVNESDEVCVKTNGLVVLDGYKDTYFVGDRIDMTTLVVRLEYAQGGGLDMMLLESMVSYDFSAPGTATVTVEYDGMQASYTVSVLPAPETQPETETETETEAETETATETESEAVTNPESEPISETDPGSDDLVSEPAVQNGCGAVLLPMAFVMIALAAFALGKKRD